MLKRRQAGRGRAGFTLIEVIAVLVLAGILAAIAGAGLTTVARGYLMARESTAVAQKAQLALTRLSNEFKVCYNCIGEPDEDITPLPGHPLTYNNVLGDNRQVGRADDTITINGVPLVDKVSDFDLRYDDFGRVMITFSLEHQQTESTLEFATGVLPRNSYQ